jgi:hypothetical protein
MGRGSGTSEDKGCSSASGSGLSRIRLNCGFPSEINLCKDVAGLGKMAWEWGYPPHPSECLAGHGFRKKSGQNLDVKELRGQDLENTRLRVGLMGLAAVRLLRP